MHFLEHTIDSELWDVISVWQMHLILIRKAAEKFLKAVESLVNELDTPTLEQFGINKEEFFNVIDKMAHDAMDSGSPQNTMRDVTEEEVKEIYRKLW